MTWPATSQWQRLRGCARSLRRCDGVDRNPVGYGYLGLLDGSHLGFLESFELWILCEATAGVNTDYPLGAIHRIRGLDMQVRYLCVPNYLSERYGNVLYFQNLYQLFRIWKIIDLRASRLKLLVNGNQKRPLWPGITYCRSSRVKTIMLSVENSKGA